MNFWEFVRFLTVLAGILPAQTQLLIRICNPNVVSDGKQHEITIKYSKRKWKIFE